MTLITLSDATILPEAVRLATSGDHIVVTDSSMPSILLEEELVLRNVQNVIIESVHPLTITGHQFAVSGCTHITLRNLRFSSSEGRFLLDRAARLIKNKLGGTRSLLIADSRDINVEHCSIRFSTDDNLDVTGGCIGIQIRDCMIYGGDGPERKAVRVGVRSGEPYINAPGYFTLERCLIVGVAYRAPKLHGGTHDVTNNLIVGQSHGSEFIEFRGDVVGNYFVPGPALKQPVIICSPARMIESGAWLAGNLIHGVSLIDDFAELWGRPADTFKPATPHEARFRAVEAFNDIQRMAASAVPEHIVAKCGPTVRDVADELAIYMARKALGITE